VSEPSRKDLVDASIPDFFRRLQQSLEEIDHEAVRSAVSALVEARAGRHTVYVIGNGGSAATAAHLASDLHAAHAARRLRAISLSDNVAVLTATANDRGWENVFTEQLTGAMEAGDVLVAISASGDSENVVRALELAREQGVVSIGLLGFGGGRARGIADHPIVVSSRDYGVVESVHSALSHLIAACFRRHVAG
jgi:D-sedoheptulose 7-phosphate isomerase